MKPRIGAPKAPPGFKVVGVARAVDMYPRPLRILAWFLWRTPFKIVSRRFGRSPYGRVVALAVKDTDAAS